MARMDSTLGASLNSTPPPPLTCRVDETGQQQLSAEIVLLSGGTAGIARFDDIDDAVTVYQYATIVDQSVINQHAPVDQGCFIRLDIKRSQ